MGIIFSPTNSRWSRPGAAWLIGCAVFALVLGSCRDKEGNHDPDSLVPPLGAAFCIPSGDVSFFALQSREVVHQIPMENWTIAAAEFHPHVHSILAVADAQNNRVALWSLPVLGVLGSASVGGSPADVACDPSGTVLYSLTRNGAFWIATLSTGRLDTIEVQVFPRRMAMRPPGNEAWVVCPGDCTLHVIDVRHVVKRDSLKFDRRPSDVVFTPDGIRALIAFEGDDGGLCELDATTFAPVRERALGHGPYDMAMSWNGRYLGIADSLDARLFVFDLFNDGCSSAAVDSGAVRVRYAETTGHWYVYSIPGNGIQVVSFSGNTLAVADTVAVQSAITDFIIWE
ncbi:MAG: hypothetical protein PHI18_01105 [bacterium]|nr:hypothetical protein [bacterium]